MWELLRRNPRFRRIFLADTVSGFGNSAMFLSLAIWAKDLTGSNAQAGLVFLIITAPGLTAPLLGDLVDRVRRKPLLLWMYGCMAVLVLSLLAVRSPDQIWIIYAVTFAYGLMFAVPARSALLKDLIPSSDAVHARSLLITFGEGVRIVSPMAGAGVYATFGGHALAFIGSGTFIVAALLLASIKVVESKPELGEEPFRKSVTAGFRYVHQVPLLFRLILVMVGFMAVIGLLETAVFAAIDEGLRQEPAFLGVVASVQGGGSVVGGVLGGLLAKRARETRVSSVGYALAALGLLLCVTRQVPLFLVGAVFIGAGLPFLMLSLQTACHLYTPSRLQGRVNAAASTVSDIAQTASIAAGTVLIGVLDYRIMYLVMAGAALVSAAMVFSPRLPAPEVVPSVADEQSDSSGTVVAAPLEGEPK
ncbi:MFS transporter [Streptosporangium sp. NPDC087985]|uniref:MFS transporter n=1 Tax=Streptosporangium sp. NPDC087985 TaxID=3366196 RepID=UPI0038107476